jgi:para-nitrobenzyl esterase
MLNPSKKPVRLIVALLWAWQVLEINGSCQAVSCFVSTFSGDVQGVDRGASCAFLGIPYAASTADSNRWKPPQPKAPWAPLVFSAMTAPSSCPSLSMPSGAPSGNEDCLKLNIWTPDPAPNSQAPVIVWLHTGSFTGASANFASHNGQRLAEETGAIVAAPNYRLGPFGFLAHRALAAEDPAYPSTGNYGLLDQRAALAWVRDNIAQFGGDPNNVTLAGTSAGGDSVGLHLVSPGSAGLFHRAIVQSGTPTVRWPTVAEAAAQGDAFAAALGCTDPSLAPGCMRSKTLSQVLLALAQGTQQALETPGRGFWNPVVDGFQIPAQPRMLFEAGAFHHVSTLIGTTRDEGWGNFINRSFPTGVTLAQYEAWVASEFGPYAPGILSAYSAANFPSATDAMARLVGDGQFVSEARRLARLIEQTGTPTFLYSYEYEIDDLSLDHVIHGVESNIIFGNNYVPPIFPNHILNAADLDLHTAMAGYWTRFAATGNPNSDDDSIVHWPAFKHPTGLGRGSDKYLVFDSVVREGQRLREEQCDFWEPFFLRSMLGGLPAAAP